MAYTRRTNQNKSFQFLKENWLFLLMGVFALPYVLRFFLSRKAVITSEEQKAEIKYLEAISGNATEQDKYIGDAATHQHKQIAREIYHHLGLAYSFYDPRHWTENDEDIFMLLKPFNPIPQGIFTAYYVISEGRNLKADLIKLLDSKYYSQLKF